MFAETINLPGGADRCLAGDDKRPAQTRLGRKPFVDLPAVDSCRQIDGQVLLFDALHTKRTVEDTDFGIERRKSLLSHKFQAGSGRAASGRYAARPGRGRGAARVVTGRRTGVAGAANVVLPVIGKVGYQ